MKKVGYILRSGYTNSEQSPHIVHQQFYKLKMEIQNHNNSS